MNADCPLGTGSFFIWKSVAEEKLMSRRLLLAIVLLIVLIAGCTEKGSQGGSVAPNFTLQDMSGKKVTLSDYKGKVVLLEFWATWCPPCRMAIPGLEKLHKAYKEKGLVLLAVSMDQGGWDDVRAFIASYGMTYTVLKGDDDVATQYQVRTIPMTLILNREGKITKRYLGMGDEEELDKDIRSVL